LYDSLLAKIISHGNDFLSAAHGLQEALQQSRLIGVGTNVAFLIELVKAGLQPTSFPHTSWIEMKLASEPTFAAAERYLGFAAACYGHVLHSSASASSPSDAFSLLRGWRSGEASAPVKTSLTVRCQTFQNEPFQHFEYTLLAYSHDSIEIAVECDQSAGILAFPASRSDDTFDATIGAEQVVAVILRKSNSISERPELELLVNGHVFSICLTRDTVSRTAEASIESGALLAALPGTILDVAISVGANVARGEFLLSIESMKMEHRILAPKDAQVRAIHVAVGDSISAGMLLLELVESEPLKQ
jgi:acetyl/propionyl-CoA carboxylase alpha subunit